MGFFNLRTTDMGPRNSCGGISDLHPLRASSTAPRHDHQKCLRISSNVPATVPRYRPRLRTTPLTKKK